MKRESDGVGDIEALADAPTVSDAVGEDEDDGVRVGVGVGLADAVALALGVGVGVACVHCDAPAALVEPAGHAVQFAAPAPEYVFAGQREQGRVR